MTMFAFPLTLKHLPGQHPQQRHAGAAQLAAQRLEELKPQDRVVRSDTERDWDALGLKRPTDAQLLETFGLQEQGISISVYTDRLGYVYLQGSLNAGEFAGMQVFQRTLARNPANDEVIVSHDSFRLPEELQKQGLGVDLLERSEALYQKIGVQKIILTANSQVGKYAWARMGFDFYGEEDTRNVVDGFYSYLQQAGVPQEDWPRSMNHPWEVAAWQPKIPILRKLHNRQVSGKEYLLYYSNSYDAAKRLDPKDEGYWVGQAYYKERRKRQKP